MKSSSTPKKNSPAVKINTNSAKDAKLLLDIITAAEDSATALNEFKEKRADLLNKTTDLRELDTIITAMNYIHSEGRQQTSKVSSVSFLLAGYDMRKKADKENG